MRTQKTCHFCEKQFFTLYKYSKKQIENSKFCSRLCMQMNMRGEQRSQKRFQVATCKVCQKSFNRNIKLSDIQWSKTVYCSLMCSNLDDERLKKIKFASLRNGNTPPIHYGSKNYNWKGGITPLNKIIRGCGNYLYWVKTILERDNYTCRLCNIRGGTLNVDHYPIMFWQIVKENKISSLEEALQCKKLWDLDNGRVLCENCHKKVTASQMQYLFELFKEKIPWTVSIQ